MIRVLHVFGGLGTGGTESLIMNWYRNIDRSKIQFDFLVRSNDNNYVAEIQELGGRIFYTSAFPKHFLENYKETKKILERKEWDVVHVHGNAAIYIIPLVLAKKYQIPCRIMHSHSVKAKSDILSILHYINRKIIPGYTTHHLACSEATGTWMFGKKEFTVLKNAVDVDKFLYDAMARKTIQREYDLEDKFVVGHVGRFATPKNHMFLLEIFKNIKKQKNNSVLMLVGDGELKNEVKKTADDLGILDSVLFMGRRGDIGKVLSAMDVFVMPSLFEGLPVACVESSANGLVSFISEEAYAKEIESLNNINVYSLKKSSVEWANLIIEKDNQKKRDFSGQNHLNKSGYDIKEVVAVLEEIYMSEREE